MVEYRWIDGDEAVERLGKTLESQGWTPLNAATSRALIAEENDEIVGFFILQLFPMAGPIYCVPEARNGKISRELAEQMRQFLVDIEARGYMAICDSPVSERICKAKGMKRIESPVYMMVGSGAQ